MNRYLCLYIQEENGTPADKMENQIPEEIKHERFDRLKELVESVRRAESIYGTGFKEVTKSEKKNKKIARKSIIAKTKIKKGDVFTEDNLICKRPGNGISPMHWYDIMGKKAEFDFEEDELIKSSYFKNEE